MYRKKNDTVFCPRLVLCSPPPPPPCVVDFSGSQGAVAVPDLYDHAPQRADVVFAPDGGGEGQTLSDAAAYGELD